MKHAWTEFLLPFLNETPLYQHINFSESVDAGNNRELLEGIRLPAYACPSNPFTNTFKTISGVNFRDWAVNHYGPGEGPMQGLAYPLCAGSILPDFIPPDCKAGENSYCVSEPAPANGESRWWYPHRVKSPGMYNRGVTSVRFKDISTVAARPLLPANETRKNVHSVAFSVGMRCVFHGQKVNSSTRTRRPVDYTQNCGSSSHHPGGTHALFVDETVRFLSNEIDHRTYCFLGDKDDGHNAVVPKE